MIGKIQRTIILGGRGQMARLLLPYLPDPTTLIDIITFEKSGVTNFLPSDRAVRRLTSSELKATSKDGKNSDGIGSLCILSIPNEVYKQASIVPGDSKLTHLLGVSGRGYNATLFVHQTSVHSLPSEVLEPISGVVLGMHLLHGPDISQFDKETVIITASNKKKAHSKYEKGYELLNYILRKRMGYKHVFKMTPGRHDTIMANIQFLTHSMLLILGDALLANDYQIEPENFHELPSSIFILLGRMSKQPPHVYKGIATGNGFNPLVSEEIKKLGAVKGDTELDWLCDAVRRFGGVRDQIIERTSMSQREQERICTPMSRVRDGIINYARTCADTTMHGRELDVRPYIDRYLLALSSGYGAYFKEIMRKTEEKLEVLNFEMFTMRKYEALRKFR